MRSTVLSLISCLFLFFELPAQNKSNFLKIHGGAEMPIGIFKEGYKAGWGIYATNFFNISEHGSVLFSAGITGWKVQDINENSGLFLAKAGYRHFISGGFYAQGDGGIAVYTGFWKGASSFTYGGGVGYLIKNKSGSGFDISARINRVTYRSWIGINIGYQFQL